LRDAASNPALARRVRSHSFKPAEELYDLQNDEFETRNLADDPAFAAIKVGLRTSLDAWMRQQGDRGLATELAAPSRQPRNTRDDDDAQPKKKNGKKAGKKNP
jgi:uncharacterized sulfatase